MHNHTKLMLTMDKELENRNRILAMKTQKFKSHNNSRNNSMERIREKPSHDLSQNPDAVDAGHFHKRIHSID